MNLGGGGGPDCFSSSSKAGVRPADDTDADAQFVHYQFQRYVLELLGGIMTHMTWERAFFRPAAGFGSPSDAHTDNSLPVPSVHLSSTVYTAGGGSSRSLWFLFDVLTQLQSTPLATQARALLSLALHQAATLGVAAPGNVYMSTALV